LCAHLGLKEEDLSAILSSADRTKVVHLLQATAEKLRTLARSCPDPKQRAALERIASRTQSASGKERHFGLSVTQLAERLALFDHAAIDAHFHLHPRPDHIQTWAGLLSYYRGAPIHEGAFGVLGGQHDALEVYKVLRHLHDFTIRVMLKTIGYQGFYVSPIEPSLPRHTDWVQAATSGNELGL
jgi:hypothetical protein